MRPGLPRARPARLDALVVVVVGLLGITLTAVVGNRLSERPGVYWSSARVTILAPQSTENPNMFQLSLRSINMTAGMIAQMVSDDQRGPRAVAPEMPLANLGVRSGWSIQQPDRGGQWSHQYSDPYVTIQVVDPDPQRVQQLMATLEKRVTEAIVQIQKDARVAPVNRFTTTTSPPTTNLYYQAGSPMRALIGTGLLGGGLTLLLVHGTLLLARRRVALSS